MYYYLYILYVMHNQYMNHSLYDIYVAYVQNEYVIHILMPKVNLLTSFISNRYLLYYSIILNYII